MDRTTARAQAMKLVYEWEMGGDGDEATRQGLLEIRPDEPETDYMNQLYDGVRAHADVIDAQLSGHLRGWTLPRLARVDLAILRVAAFELLQRQLPASIVINEAVELANQYSTDKAGTFINGVLGNLNRALEASESDPD